MAFWKLSHSSCASRFRRALLLVLSVICIGSVFSHAVLAEDRPVLRIGDQRGAIKALLKVAGELDQIPYRLEWSIFPVGAPLVEAIAANALDFGYVGDATATFALAGHAPIKTINVWRFHGFGAALIVPEKSSIHKLADLKAKKIALVRGSPAHLLVAAAFKQAGIPLSETHLINLTVADAKAALASGSVDAWAIWDPFIAAAELNDHARVILSSQGIIDEVLCGVASDRAIATKRAQLLDFIARVQRAHAWADSHIPDYARVYADDTGVSYEVALKTIERMKVVVTQAVEDQDIAVHQKVADLYFELGIIPAHLDVTQAYDRSFVVGEAGASRSP
ncbi:ABC transporter substrate-binding protein [Beijerinckia indica]|uniref:Putative aliphatic sulfonates-binding protein n=1 Tax=Beijerinckia indica subsp. indica (strain ATCC 9039 / DSM 1715 / NCIMB 8712) TaxID=395963 RepID=B2IHN2_BEII9|nr:ABC transporter substrate-binding protein [Beijerinckia indica]ACB94553.1 aliphatic sulfonates family ABC transporter, periplsmic ligand-binding protein [Beijerinckia indica subsp. indica ATCC 9039]